jgi:hypothetical protein
LQSRRSAATIEGVEKDATRVRVPFAPGAIVVLTLSAPREKFWGMILALTPEGLSLSGIERIDLDVPDGNLPSLSQRFAAKTGQEPSTFLPSTGANQIVNRRDAAPAESSVDKEPA